MSGPEPRSVLSQAGDARVEAGRDDVSLAERGIDITVAADPPALAEAAAGELLRLGTRAIAARGRFVVALSGGSTPRAMHARLASETLRRKLDWSRVEIFWSDERAVGPDDPQSNYRMARETLLDPLRIDAGQVHRMRGEAPDLDAAAREYEDTVLRVAGAGSREAVPAFDLVLLGMGSDGHTASLFPGTAALNATGRLVVANDVPQLSTHRLTFTFDLILAARAVWILVAGVEKAGILQSVRQGPLAADRYPVQRLLGAPPVRWLVDRAAASRLEDRITPG
jgi:6-phosphogluconolactonase